MSRNDIHIRAARTGSAGDADALAELMRGLHKHLKQPHEHISADKLLRDVLCEASVHGVLLAERRGKPCGYALFHETYESVYAQRGLYMADLFVTQDARRHGVGRALVAAVAAHAMTRDMKFLWWVSEAWDEQAQGFYVALGASHDPMIAHSLSFENFDRLADEGSEEKN
jgi:GNAT superfamily N-acetyltransferase